MININFTVSPALLQGTHAKQLPYALSKTINETLKIAQTQFLATLPTEVHLRGTTRGGTKPGTALGFNIKFSTKANLAGTLGSRAPWWPLQETGGTKTVSGHRLAIAPSRAPFGARPSVEAVIPAKMKPRKVLVRKGDVIKGRGKRADRIARRDAKGFIIQIKPGVEGVFVREGNKNRLLYVLEPQAHVKPALNFFATTKAAVDKNVGVIFTREFNKAVEGAK